MPAPADPAPPAAAAPAPAPSVQVTRYRASDELAKALERLLPLRALQPLGKLSEEQREKFGLTASEVRLSVEARGQTLVLALGNPTYGGSSTYVERLSDGECFLVAAGPLKILDFRPPRYMERRLVGKPAAEVDWLQVDCAGQGRRVLTRAPLVPGQPERWAPEEDPSAVDELYRNWTEKVLRLGAQEYLEQIPAEPPERPLSRCSLALRGAGQPIDELELRWREETPGKVETYARSAFTGAWVKLEANAAGQVISDLPALFGASLPPAH